jgi:uncharacterized protein (DUF58 family)
MSRLPTGRVRSLAMVGGASLVLALALGVPELAAVGAGAAVVLMAGLLTSGSARLELQVDAEQLRVVEGDSVGITVHLATHGRTGSVVVWVSPSGPMEVEFFGSTPNARETDHDRGFTVELPPLVGSAKVDVEVRYQRWGIHQLPEVGVKVVDWFGLFEQRVVAREERRRVRVLPTEEAIKRLFVPYRVGAGLGDLLSANRGDGLEFADLRPFRPGDDLRRVAHRASARAGGLWVSDRHPERNADVILLADLLFDRGPGNRGVVDQVVQGAASLASAHISRHDRVGLVVLGGTVRWVTPRMGAIHRYRVLDALLETQLMHGWAGPMAGLLVARIVSGHALVVALTPLLDDVTVTLISDLRGRGFDVMVVECDPEPHIPPARKRSEQIARRIWSMERAALRRRLEERGVVVAGWPVGVSLGAVVLEANGRRRLGRPA